MTGSAPPGEPPAREDPAPWIDRVVRPFFRDQLLWPVGFVILAHAGAFLAPVLLLSVLERRPAAIVALAGAVWGSIAGVRLERRRPAGAGPLCAAIGATWLLAALLAVLFHRHGFF
jgi:hypothetical protein